MTKKKILPRRAKDVAFAALPPAIICKPLRFIREQTAIKVTDTATGTEHWAPGPEFERARKLADVGDGGAVQSMARRLALAA